MKDNHAGSLIFLSHSHNDINEVRRVRDALEAKGHNPLLFFLKCLDDNSELDDLIRREIEARNFFLLCDSPNAQSSRWVQHEVELIKSMNGKVYRSIDLGGPWQPQLDIIDDLSRQATVFMCYAHRDRTIADQMVRKLRALDYRVLNFRDITPGTSWTEELHQLIDTALANGSVVLLMSPEAMTSKGVHQEALYAAERRAAGASNIRPFVIRDPKTVYALLHSRPEWAPFADMQWIELTDIESLSLAELSRMMDPTW
ncbi:MAG: toll/interleukin-1 receptor domain-containing protein [Mycobacterium sp.]|nr:toll/interleukin-1 receptor domain-containing protein [Mycobacterium sp.]MBV9721714.1 toll/interleukin-1 receptor domain-containing protein [Mycobacterium sp.]